MLVMVVQAEVYFQYGDDRHLGFRKTVPFLQYLTAHDHIWWECYDIDLEHIFDVENVKVTKIEDRSSRHLRV